MNSNGEFFQKYIDLEEASFFYIIQIYLSTCTRKLQLYLIVLVVAAWATLGDRVATRSRKAGRSYATRIRSGSGSVAWICALSKIVEDDLVGGAIPGAESEQKPRGSVSLGFRRSTGRYMAKPY